MSQGGEGEKASLRKAASQDQIMHYKEDEPQQLVTPQIERVLPVKFAAQQHHKELWARADRSRTNGK